MTSASAMKGAHLFSCQKRMFEEFLVVRVDAVPRRSMGGGLSLIMMMFASEPSRVVNCMAKPRRAAATLLAS